MRLTKVSLTLLQTQPLFLVFDMPRHPLVRTYSIPHKLTFIDRVLSRETTFSSTSSSTEDDRYSSCRHTTAWMSIGWRGGKCYHAISRTFHQKAICANRRLSIFEVRACPIPFFNHLTTRGSNYISVFVSGPIDPSAKMPVVFWIHGGGFVRSYGIHGPY